VGGGPFQNVFLHLSEIQDNSTVGHNFSFGPYEKMKKKNSSDLHFFSVPRNIVKKCQDWLNGT